jgi:hypothetical protein
LDIKINENDAVCQAEAYRFLADEWDRCRLARFRGEVAELGPDAYCAAVSVWERDHLASPEHDTLSASDRRWYRTLFTFIRAAARHVAGKRGPMPPPLPALPF